MPTTEAARRIGSARPVAFAGALAISLSPVWVRLASVEPVTAAFFRAAYALPLLAGLWFRHRTEDRRGPAARAGALLAGVLLGLDLIFWHRAIELIGTGLATVLGNTQVVVVGMVAWLLHRERPRAAAIALVPLVLVGVGLISGLGRPEAFGQDPFIGCLFGLLTGITYAGFLIVLRAANRGLAPASGPLLDATVGAAAAAWLVGVASGDLELAWSWPSHLWLVGLALGSQVIGWLLITAALPRLPALDTSVVLLLQPMTTVLWGTWLFDEALSPIQWAGIALVLGGVGGLSWRGTAG